MNRITLLIGGAAMVVALATSAVAQEVTLRLHQFLPLQSAIPGNAIQPWIEKTENGLAGMNRMNFGTSLCSNVRN